MKTDMNPVVSRQKHTLDASGQVLGRLASKIANLLRGKDKADFVPHLDIGDWVEILNPGKIILTGNKKIQKVYRRHSGYIGNLKETPVLELLEKHPDKIIYMAVWGMLPKNRLRKNWIKRLSFRQGAGDSNG